MQPPKPIIARITKEYNRFMGNEVSPSPPRGWEHHRGKLRRIRARSMSPDTTDRLMREAREEQRYRDRIDAMRQVSDQEVQLAVDNMIAGITAQYGINLDENDGHVRWIIERLISVHGLTDAAVRRIQRCRPLLYAISGGITGAIPAMARGAQRLAAGLVRTATARASRWGRSRSVEPIRVPGEPRALGFATRALTGLYSVLTRIYEFLGTCAGAACHAITTRLSAVDRVVPIEAVNLECAICMADAIVGQVAGQAPVLTHCNHRFHQSCIDQWFTECTRTNRPETCPYCRQLATPLSQALAGGGGFKNKYRRTRSKSKSRRYPRKPHKTRKVYP